MPASGAVPRDALQTVGSTGSGRTLVHPFFLLGCSVTHLLKGIYTPAGIAYIFKFGLTWSLHLLYDTGCLSY